MQAFLVRRKKTHPSIFNVNFLDKCNIFRPTDENATVAILAQGKPRG